MNIQKECVECIVGQIDKALRVLDINDLRYDKIMNEVKNQSLDFSYDHTPPFVAKDPYAYLSKELGLEDPLYEIKQQSIQKAIELLPIVYSELERSEDKLFSAIKASVAGNVIDFGAKEQYSIEDEINSVFKTNFAIDRYKDLKSNIEKYDDILILADNSGENVFDKVLLEVLNKLYPNKNYYYATRGRPIINDITIKEAYQIGIDRFATILDSGVDTPGLDLSRASGDFKEFFYRVPLIIAKGMGNYECLEQLKDDRIFFLFKVKCDVVAKSIGQKSGDLILAQFV